MMIYLLLPLCFLFLFQWKYVEYELKKHKTNCELNCKKKKRAIKN